MEKERLITLLNRCCNDFDSLEKIMSQKNMIINNKRMMGKELKCFKGDINIYCYDSDKEKEIVIKCHNKNGILSEFE